MAIDYDAQNAANMGRVINNLTMILVLCTEIIKGTAQGIQPTDAQINAVVNAAGTAGVPNPKPTYTVDGETYNWTEYQTFIADKLEQYRKMMIFFAGPFEVRSRGMT